MSNIPGPVPGEDAPGQAMTTGEQNDGSQTQQNDGLHPFSDPATTAATISGNAPPATDLAPVTEPLFGGIDPTIPADEREPQGSMVATESKAVRNENGQRVKANTNPMDHIPATTSEPDRRPGETDAGYDTRMGMGDQPQPIIRQDYATNEPHPNPAPTSHALARAQRTPPNVIEAFKAAFLDFTGMVSMIRDEIAGELLHKHVNGDNPVSMEDYVQPTETDALDLAKRAAEGVNAKLNDHTATSGEKDAQNQAIDTHQLGSAREQRDVYSGRKRLPDTGTERMPDGWNDIGRHPTEPEAPIPAGGIPEPKGMQAPATDDAPLTDKVQGPST